MTGARPGEPAARRFASCFVSAGRGANTDTVVGELHRRGIQIAEPPLDAGAADYLPSLRSAIGNADLMIGVLSRSVTPSVYFELGIAAALGRPTILVAPPSVRPFDFSSQQLLVLRTSASNGEAVGFALDQILAGPPSKADVQKGPTASTGLGDQATGFSMSLKRAVARRDYAEVERIVFEVLRATAGDVVRASTEKEAGADFAVWSDEWQATIGNPLLIDVKVVQSTNALSSAARQLAESVQRAAGRWGLLLYAVAGSVANKTPPEGPPTVLWLQLETLPSNVQDQSFPSVVRHLRNRRVHGVD